MKFIACLSRENGGSSENWTATREKIKGIQTGWRLQGTTNLWMFLIYGGALVLLFEPMHNALRDWPWPLRGLDAPAWLVMGLTAEWVHDFLVTLTPAIQTALLASS